MRSLEEHFAVDVREELDLEPDLERAGTARASIRITPRDEAAAPLTVVFSTFPGLHVRFGRWGVEHLPACGCDACNEQVDDLIARFQELVEALTGGGLREEVVRGLIRGGSYSIARRGAPAFGSVWQKLDRKQVQAMTGGKSVRITWEPWPRRK
jgi:hypothetical protein